MMVCQNATSGSEQKSVFLHMECWSIGVLEYWDKNKNCEVFVL